MQREIKHISVLLYEAINALNIKKDGIYIDCTFGCGGHSRLILSKLNKNGQLIAIDRDPYAINSADIQDSRFSIIHGKFSLIEKYVSERELIGKIHGVLIDCGMSSLQLDNAQRGFSFMHDGPLDMRMDPTKGYSAAEWLLNTKEKDIMCVLKRYGEERFAKRIARAIVEYNHKKPITNTKELVKLITQVIPFKDKFKHPATRSFQAIRIWINSELKEIDMVLKSSLSVLSSGGRIAIISFNSLEDRLIKCFMRNNSRYYQVPRGMAMTETQLKAISSRTLRVFKKIIPNRREVYENPRARSAILRVAEKI